MTGSAERRTLLVESVRRESESVVSLSLVDAAGADLPEWTAGAHIEIQLANGLIRHYSLCGSVDDRSAWRIGVLREQESRGGSHYIHDELQVGHSVQLRRLRNQFPLSDATEHIFIAGGIGITPILPMIRELHAVGRPYRAYYCGRSRSHMAFIEDLPKTETVNIVPFDTAGLLDIAAVLENAPAGASVYCCGPAPLIDAVKTIGTRTGVAVHFENFRAAQSDAVGAGDDDSAEQGSPTEIEFEIVLERSGVSLPVPRNRSILEVLEVNRIPKDFSCREGTCGTCETAVLAGQPDHRDSVLDDEEKAAGDTMMICVSRSLSKRLTLDL